LIAQKLSIGPEHLWPVEHNKRYQLGNISLPATIATFELRHEALILWFVIMAECIFPFIYGERHASLKGPAFLRGRPFVYDLLISFVSVCGQHLHLNQTWLDIPAFP
jgi:hypothetical protein